MPKTSCRVQLDAFYQGENAEFNLHRYEVASANQLSASKSVPFWQETLVRRSNGIFWSGEVSNQDSINTALKRFEGNIS